MSNVATETKLAGGDWRELMAHAELAFDHADYSNTRLWRKDGIGWISNVANLDSSAFAFIDTSVYYDTTEDLINDRSKRTVVTCMIGNRAVSIDSELGFLPDANNTVPTPEEAADVVFGAIRRG